MATPSTCPPGHHHRAVKGQAYPIAEQAQVYHGWFGASRYTYNALLHLLEYSYHYKAGDAEQLQKLKARPDLECLYPLMQLETYQDEYAPKPYRVGANQSFLGYLVSCLKSHSEKTWLREVPRTVLSYTVDALIAAFQGFYRLVKLRKHIGPQGLIGFPCYKTRRSKQAIRLQASDCAIASNPDRPKVHEIRLPMPRVLEARLLHPLPTLKVRGLRRMSGRLLTIGLSRSPSGDYSISVLLEAVKTVRPSGFGVVGIDLTAQRHEVGYCFDGQPFRLSDLEALPKPIHPLERRIRHLQTLLARKTKGGSAWRRMKRKIAQAHQRLSAIYEGYYHRLTHRLLERYDTVILEDLDVRSMLQEGHSSLAKLISDSRFARFRQLLEHKVEGRVRSFIGIADRYYPSTQRCSACGAKPANRIPMAVKAWTCQACDAEHHRDYNAAKNLWALAATIVEWPRESAQLRLDAYAA